MSLDRLMARRVKLKFYEAGMDMGWSSNPAESFRLFQGKVLDEYDRLVDEFVCLDTPEDFYAVGQFYENFMQVEDHEVIDLLQRAEKSPARNPAETHPNP